MAVGFLMLVGTGLAWALFGVMLSYTARNGVSASALLGPQRILTLIFVFTVLPDYGALAAGVSSEFWLMVAVLITAGVVNASGILVLQRAMQTGPNGIAWAIGQSALVIPFLAGVAIFGEPPTTVRVLGVVAILISMVFFSMARQKPTADTATTPSGHWFLLAIAAMVTLGSAQTLTTLPAHLKLEDPALLRVPMLSLGNALVFLGIWSRRPQLPGRGILALAVFSTIVGIAGSIALFNGLDRLAEAQMASLGYPIAVSTCLIGFVLYSLLALGETCTRWHLAGLAAGVAGVVCLAMGG